MKPRLVIVGNPACRRVNFWQAAASRRGWQAGVVPYAALLRRTTRLAAYLSPGAVVRFESAAENWDTYKQLLHRGCSAARREHYEVLAPCEIDCLEYERGWLVKPRQAHLGFIDLLTELKGEVEAGGASALNSAGEIAICFDKTLCQERLREASVPIPRSLGAVDDYETIRARYLPDGRAMVKLAHGSGASGCIALHWSGGRVRALTTVAEVTVRGQARLYASKRLRYLLDESTIAGLLTRLSREKIQVEDWLPKARWQGRNFDLRVVTIAGRARHCLPRVNNSPFTNLTLGGRHGDWTAVHNHFGCRALRELRGTCAKVAEAFPGSFTLGIDVLISPDWRRHAVLEVNAFGDLLLGQLHKGEDTYTATLSAWERGGRPARSSFAEAPSWT